MQNKFWPLIALLSLFFIGCKKDAAKKLIITSINPDHAKGGDTITIYGRNFFTDGAPLNVLINNRQTNITFSSDDSIKIVVPGRTGSGNVNIVTNISTYTGPYFTYDYVAYVSTIAGNGSVGNSNGPALSTSFNFPWGVAIDNNGDVYISDDYNGLIRKIDTTTKMVSSIPAYMLPFVLPYNIAIDTISKSIYATDFNAHVLKINSSGAASVIFTGPAPLSGIGIGPDRKLYIANNSTGQIFRMDTTGLNQVVYAPYVNTPRNIIFDKDGKMFVAGAGIYKVENGTPSLILPNPSQFHGWEIAVDTVGNFYEADYFNNCIRKIDKQGNFIVIAGNGDAIDRDGIGLNSSFNGPRGIAIDKEGSLYITTYNFSTSEGNKVRKITFY